MNGYDWITWIIADNKGAPQCWPPCLDKRARHGDSYSVPPFGRRRSELRLRVVFLVAFLVPENRANTANAVDGGQNVARYCPCLYNQHDVRNLAW
jgi:hypothetical protein